MINSDPRRSRSRARALALAGCRRTKPPELRAALDVVGRAGCRPCLRAAAAQRTEIRKAPRQHPGFAPMGGAGAGHRSGGAIEIPGPHIGMRQFRSRPRPPLPPLPHSPRALLGRPRPRHPSLIHLPQAEAATSRPAPALYPDPPGPWDLPTPCSSRHGPGLLQCGVPPQNIPPSTAQHAFPIGPGAAPGVFRTGVYPRPHFHGLVVCVLCSFRKVTCNA